MDAFPSVPHLEALLLLRRAGEDVETVPAMAERLYIDGDAAATVLADLVAAGLVERHESSPATFRYAPRTPRQAALVDRLQVLYSRALMAVTSLIHERPAQLFADAFRFRKE